MARHIWIPVTIAALLLSACERKPEGQVVAVVNGKEITQGEVNEELKGSKLPQGADQTALRQAAVQSLVQRQLLAAAAIDDGVAKDPAYLIQRKQLEDRLLVQFLAQRAARNMARPDPGEINAFINANPGAFANRVIWTVNRLQFAAPKGSEVVKAMAGDHSLDAITARLRAAGVQYSQDVARLDSASMTPEIYGQIANLPAGEPFVRAQDGFVTAAAIVAKEDAPVTGPAAQEAAANRLVEQRVGSRLDTRLRTLKATAKIEYQKGYGPPRS